MWIELYDILKICLRSESMFRFGCVGIMGLTHAKKIFCVLCRMTPRLPNTRLHRSDPLTGSSAWHLNFISIYGRGEIPRRRYRTKCAINSCLVKSLNRGYLNHLLPVFAIVAFTLSQNVRSSNVTALSEYCWLCSLKNKVQTNQLDVNQIQDHYQIYK